MMANSRISFNIPAVFLMAILTFTVMDLTAGQTGVCYGRLGSNLPSASQVVSLYNQYNIRRMRIYDPHQPTLQALSNTNIELILGVPNTDLQGIASSQATANAWIQNNVRNYPNVRFRYIAVGNEVSPLRSDTAQYVSFVLPALRNIQTAVSQAGLGGVRVTTALEMGLIDNGYPPSAGVFRPEVRDYATGIINFLRANNNAPVLVNVYPYFSYVGNPGQIALDYALFTSQNGITTPDGVRYQNLFYALVDAFYSALERAGGSSLEIVVSESGWPSSGNGGATTVENARLYNTNLIQRVRSGTPKRPGRAIEAYIFSMLDEDQKNPEIEKHFGIFDNRGGPKYGISFN